MARKSNPFLTAKAPSAAELSRIRKRRTKAARDLKALREKQQLQQDIQRKRKEIRSLRFQQGKVGRLLSRAQSEFKATEGQRKKIGKDIQKIQKKLK